MSRVYTSELQWDYEEKDLEKASRYTRYARPPDTQILFQQVSLKIIFLLLKTLDQ